MTEKQKRKRANPQDHMPDAEVVAAQLAKVESMMAEELNDHLIYELYEV